MTTDGNGMRQRTSAALSAALAAVLLAASGECRESVCLNGEWDFLPLSEPRLGERPTEGWADERISVPSWWTAPEFEYAPDVRRAEAGWYHRNFVVPDGWQGRRLWLSFGGAFYRTKAYVNGIPVGSHDGGFSPFCFDITEAAKPGENELTVGVIGWRAALKPEMIDVEAASTREVPGGLIGPVGFSPRPGIWQDVFLEATGGALIENVFVRTELKPKSRAVATVTCFNPTEREVQLGVRGAIRPLPPGARYDTRLPELPKWLCGSEHLRLRPRERGSVDLVQLPEPLVAWNGARPDIHLWWPGEPALYQFAVQLTGRGGRPLDRVETRFGYREVTWKGPSLLINGVPIHLRGEGRCGWSSHHLMPEHIRGWYRMVQEANCNTVRLHAGHFSEEYLDIADELGVMTVVESAPLWCHAGNYDFGDERFWENSKQQLAERVLAWRNHPSLVIWSVENELLMTGGHRFDHSIENMAELGDLTKQLDPTRPMMYEGDADVAGRADIVNLHYPYEYPRHTFWPNDAHWLSRDAGQIDTWPHDFRWEHQKPLVVGEFLNNWCSIPDWRSMLVGDAAYGSRRGTLAAWAMAVRMQIEGYRWAGCTGIHPWSTLWPGVEWKTVDIRPDWPDPSAPGVKPRHITRIIINPGWLPDEPLYEPNAVFEAEKRAFSPQAAFIREYNTRFCGGENVERTVVLLNDTLEAAEMELRVSVKGDGLQLSIPPIRKRVPPAGRRRETFSLMIPKSGWNKRDELEMRLELLADGQSVYRDAETWSRFPNTYIDVPENIIALVDPRSELRPKLPWGRVPLHDFLSPSRPSAIEVIIVAPNTLVGLTREQREDLKAAVHGGARLLCLNQRDYPPDFLPGIQLSDVWSTMVFPRAPDDSPLSNVRRGDLRFWRSDHIVTGRNFIKPAGGPYRAIIDCGGYPGLAYTPLLEVAYGQGTILLCQMLVGEKLRHEPAAALLMNSLLRYMRFWKKRTMPVEAVCDPVGPLARSLDDLGVVWTPTDDLSALEPGRRCLIVGPEPSSLARVVEQAEPVRQFVHEGGQVVLHGLSPATVSLANELTGCALQLRPRFGFSATHMLLRHGRHLLPRDPLDWNKTAGPIASAGNPLRPGASNHDLYWIKSEAWNRAAEPSAEIAEWGVTNLPEGAYELIEDGLLAKIPLHKGFFIIDQIRWPEAMHVEPKAARYACLLLQNVYGEIGFEPTVRPVAGDFFTIDLSEQCNMGFADEVAGDGQGGWTDQGKGWDMARFPTGRQTLGGVPFDIIDPATNDGRSCIILHAPEHGPAFPTEATGIPVGRKAGMLHFLVSAAWSQTARDGDVIAEVVAHHEGGSRQIIPIRYGIDAIDWFYEPRRLANAAPAWIGANDVRDPIAIYRFAWRNPSPDLPIRSLDVRSLDKGPIPILIAVTGDALAAQTTPARARFQPVTEALRLAAGDLDITVHPTGALDIASGGQTLFGAIALRLHNNERGKWAQLASQWPNNNCTMAAEYRNIAGTTEVQAEGALGYLDVVEQLQIGKDGSISLRYDCEVARAPEKPELVMGLLLNLTMPEVWAGGQASADDGREIDISRDVAQTNRLGTGAGNVLWQTGDERLPAFDVGTSGRVNFFDARFFSAYTEPQYTLQLFPAENPTEVGSRFTLRVAIVPAR